jgi:hypothetical protein
VIYLPEISQKFEKKSKIIKKNSRQKRLFLIIFLLRYPVSSLSEKKLKAVLGMPVHP